MVYVAYPVQHIPVSLPAFNKEGSFSFSMWNPHLLEDVSTCRSRLRYPTHLLLANAAESPDAMVIIPVPTPD
jgi:hypothetical protein